VHNKKHQDFIYDYLQTNNLNALTSKLQCVDGSVLDGLFRGKVNHQGFVVEASRKPRLSFGTFLKKCEGKERLPRLLILDQLTDPHNIGAMIRTACAFGITNVIATKYNFPQEGSTIIKSSAGMTEFVDLIEVVNLSKTMEELEKLGYTTVGLDGYATTYINEVKADNIALILGSEGKGIRPLVKKNCNILTKIPMSEKVESLNASVAGAIAMYELWGK